MSPDDDSTQSQKITSSARNGVVVVVTSPNGIEQNRQQLSINNGLTIPGSVNGYTCTNGGTNGRRGSGHVWSPLLDKESQYIEEMDMYDTSNNNDWKVGEELKNLRNSLHCAQGNNNGSLMNGKNGIGLINGKDQMQSDNGRKTHISDTVPTCGIFQCRPKWARSLASTHVFMVVFLLAWILQGMFLTYFVSVITTIEKLFQIKSKTTGMLMSAGEIGQISTALLLTYYAGRGHRPRWIAFGMVIFAIASFSCALPHFIFGEQLMHSLSVIPNADRIVTTTLIHHNNDSSINFNDLNLCHISNNFTLNNVENDECEADVKIEQASHSKITFIVLCIFFVSLLSAGVGQTAVSTLGIPYIDDNVASKESPMYMAITIGVRILGPAAGFIVGSFCTRIYVDLTNPGFDSTDGRWISAWWLGPVLIGTIMMLASIAMFMFPKHLNGNRITGPDDNTKTDHKIVKRHEAEMKPQLRDFPKTVSRQLKNDILMFRTASCVFHLLPIAGLYTFLPKYLETQFRLPAADANLISAFGGIMVMGLGIVVSGIFIQKINPSARHVAAWIAFTAFIYSGGMILLMFVGCNMSDFVGLSKATGTINRVYAPACNVSCSCDWNKFAPVCGVDNRMYFSSCHAGCQSVSLRDGKSVFGHCQCLDDVNEFLLPQATSGYCNGSCQNFIIFICLFAFFVFMHSTSEVGSMLLIMRCTHPKDKAMAMGVIQSAIGLFGNVPCPIIYGAVVDSACLVWKTVCGKPGACSLYDNDIFRQYFLGITASIMFLAFLMDLVVWHKANRIDITPEKVPTNNGCELTAMPESHV